MFIVSEPFLLADFDGLNIILCLQIVKKKKK